MIDLTKNHHLRAHQNHQKYEFYSYIHRQFFWIIVAVIAAFLKRLQNQKPVFVIQALKLQTHALIADYSWSNRNWYSTDGFLCDINRLISYIAITIETVGEGRPAPRLLENQE
ncbi:MAG: hypothetical protein WCG16_10085 [Methylococcales bacterium]